MPPKRRVTRNEKRMLAALAAETRIEDPIEVYDFEPISNHIRNEQNDAYDECMRIDQENAHRRAREQEIEDAKAVYVKRCHERELQYDKRRAAIYEIERHLPPPGYRTEDEVATKTVCTNLLETVQAVVKDYNSAEELGLELGDRTFMDAQLGIEDIDFATVFTEWGNQPPPSFDAQQHVRAFVSTLLQKKKAVVSANYLLRVVGGIDS